MTDDTHYYDTKIASAILECQKVFGPRNVVLLSNEIGSEHDRQVIQPSDGGTPKAIFPKAQEIERNMNIRVLRHPALDIPGIWQDVEDAF